MVNQCVLVGKVKELPVLKKTNGGVPMASIVLEMDRQFKNSDGSVSTDVFQVTLWRGIAETCQDICKVGTIIAVKGRLQGTSYEKDKHTYYNTEVVAEKVSLLSPNAVQESQTSHIANA